MGEYTRDVSKVRSHNFDLEKYVVTKHERRGNVYEGSLNTVFFFKLNLITSFSIYESLCKKWGVQRHLIVKCKL